jgi:diacylglycerol kinase family enzyme
VVQGLDLGLKRRLGRGAYVVQSLREMGRYRFPRIAVEVDGVVLPGTVASAIVTKGRLYAGRHLLAPEARPDAPGFQVALFRHGGPGFAALAGAALPLDLLPRLPGVTLCPARTVRLWAAGEGESVPAQADGDPAGALPLRIEDAPGTLSVLLPGIAAGRVSLPGGGR